MIHKLVILAVILVSSTALEVRSYNEDGTAMHAQQRQVDQARSRKATRSGSGTVEDSVGAVGIEPTTCTV